MNLFQWVFITFCGIQFLTSLSRFRRSRSNVALLFAAGWATAIVLLLDPMLATDVAERIGIGRGADFVLYTLSFIFLWSHYQHYVRYRRLEEDLTELVRELAMERAVKQSPAPPA